MLSELYSVIQREIGNLEMAQAISKKGRLNKMEAKEHTIMNVTFSEEEYKAIRTTATLINRTIILLDKTDVYNTIAHKFMDRETLEEALDYLMANFEVTEP